MYASGQYGSQSPTHQHSYFMPSSPGPNPNTPTSQYFYQKQTSPPPFQYSPSTSNVFASRNRYARKSDEAEPMSTSPISLHQTSREFLPSFLTGDQGQTSFSRGLSPGTPERRRNLSMSFSEPFAKGPPEKGLPDIGSKSPTKQGPPISGLGRVNESSTSPLFPVASAFGSENSNLNMSSGFLTSLVSPIKLSNSADFNGSKPPITSPWVTVFGFSANSVPLVLSHFAHVGTIIESKTVPGSNWIHLHFSNVIEARRALQRNGTLIGGGLMVGVSPCSEELAKEGLPPGSLDFFQGSPLSRASSLPGTGLNKENVAPGDPLAGPSNSNLQSPASASRELRGRMRSLGRDGRDLQLPQRKSGFVSWALDTIFGW